ncbi:hypothetical protein COCVIDRAFT_104668, partial [Bipolaris victoriae FI3]
FTTMSLFWTAMSAADECHDASHPRGQVWWLLEGDGMRMSWRRGQIRCPCV